MNQVKVDLIPAVIRVIVCHDGEIRHGAFLPPETDGLEELRRANMENPSCGHHSVESYRNERFSKARATR
jgi:hypothetical protein